MNIKIHIWIIGALMLFLSGCVEEIDRHVYPGEYITFTAGMSSYTTKGGDALSSVAGKLGVEEEDWIVEAGTKASPTVRLTGSAGVIAYMYDGAWTGKETPWPEMANSEFVFEGNMLSARTPVRWTEVSKERLKVYAYAPYMELEGLGATAASDMAIPYSVPAEVGEQLDIIVAKQDVVADSEKNGSIDLDFQHILTAVRFKMGFGSNVKVKSLTVNNVYGAGRFSLGGNDGSGWSFVDGVHSQNSSFSIDLGDGREFSSGDMINEDDLTLMLIPQTLSSASSLTLEYTDGTEVKSLVFPLDGKTWGLGRMVTYTLYDAEQNTPIYFDLAAGNVHIGFELNNDTYKTSKTGSDRIYKGFVFDGAQKKEVYGVHDDDNQYYVYQSAGTGGVPDHPAVTLPDGTLWTDFIENNTSVASVITGWTEAVESTGRTSTPHRIHVQGSDMTVRMTIDDIWSSYEHRYPMRSTGGIGFVAEGNAALLLDIQGDNRLGNIHYCTGLDYTNRLEFNGTGSVTVAAVGGKTDSYYSSGDYWGETVVNDTTFASNFWCAAIGGDDFTPNYLSSRGHSHGIVINSGNVFAGTTKAENCTAIGAGGNDHATITINGGTVTAVASTTGTAIGGGIGFGSSGGVGNVTITGGNVYAYNHSNRWDIPSSAIGGAGSRNGAGNIGNVTITGGNVYAQAAMGTAIGGGSSMYNMGGNAVVEMSGGHVVARSVRAESGLVPGTWVEAGAGIGGGSGCTSGANNNYPYVNGGSAERIIVSGNAVVETGSIGGGKSGHENGFIGTAVINVSGGYVQGQFVMAAGSSTAPTFTMTGGVIRNSKTADDADDYYNIVKNGGAVYMEDGKFDMSGGTITGCSAEKGGAVYISKGEKSLVDPSFSMKGGIIENCISTGDGGAVYLENGTVTISGSAQILDNVSRGSGGAVCVRKTSSSVPSFTMSGGHLDRNVAVSGGGAVYIEGGSVTVSGGSISGNLVEEGNGGAVCINSGSFTMPSDGAAEINGNVAQMSSGSVGGYGGGVYVTSGSEKVDVDILSGMIKGNSSSKRGGGIAVDMSSGVEAEVVVGVSGSSSTDNPDITGNVTLYEGGGLYVNGSAADVIINSGQIVDNRTVGYVANPDVMNEGGMVTLNGGEVASVYVHYEANYENAAALASQRIVTDTKNILSAPSVSRNGFKFVRWNTRQDGLGTDYTDGQIVKRSSDLTLYAIWTVD